MKQDAAKLTQGGVRRKRVRQPIMSSNGDSTLVKYSALSATLATRGTTGTEVNSRYFVPGWNFSGSTSAGPSIVSYYSSGKFLPGTKIRWEPSVSFTTTGRVFVAFTDNPEVATSMQSLAAAYVAAPSSTTFDPYINAIRGMGSVISFPLWQETDIPFPTRLRRKRFDVNASIAANPDTLDRCMQTSMWVAVEGGPSTATPLGGFWFHDVLDVEGVQPLAT